MQTSSMMLDSTVGKMLTAEQVNSQMQIEEEDEIKKASSAIQSSTTPEAEVRLVVRLIVEERIVFNGKVERVNQLESEELSRLVSRVAWVGSKEGDKSISQSEDDVVHKKLNSDSDNTLQRTLSMSENNIRENTTIQPLEQFESFNDSVQHVQEKSTCNTESSDHLTYVKSSLNLLELPEKQEDLVAQVVELSSSESNTKVECDINVETTQIHKCETNQQCLQDLSSGQELEKQAENKVQNTPTSNIGIKHFEVPVDDSCLESQSIADTLNDCVNNVDLESRISLEKSNDVSQNRVFVEQDAINMMLEQSNHINVVKIKEICADIEIGPYLDRAEDTAVNVQEYNNESADALSKGFVIKESVRSEQTSDRNYFNQTIFHSTEKASSASTKKKPSLDHSSSSKRISKSAAKEHQNPKIRTNAKDKSIGKTNKQNLAPIKINTTISLLANNKPQRPVKIFAKWSDNHFYPGTIIKRTRDRKYVISFFDGAQRNVAETDLIPLSNIAGKQVRVTVAKNYCANAIVHEQRSSVNDQPMFNVEYQQDGLVRKCVPLKDIFLTGEQGSPLINQPDKNSGASNFADVDLDNIIYEKRSRRFQEMEDFELTENSTVNNKRKRSQYNMRNITPRPKASPTTNECLNNGLTSIHEGFPQNVNNQDTERAKSTDVLKTNFLCPNSNPPFEGSSSTGSSNIPSSLELGQEYYFTSSSPHRTKASLLL